MSTRYWLMKSEPSTFSIDDLQAAPKKTACWEGVRNYQARNLLRDEFQRGDRVLFYHSACAEPAVVGTARVVKEAYADHFSWDPQSPYYDPKSSPENVRWFMVDIQLETKFPRPVTLAEMRGHAPLAAMPLLRRGNRLSVQPVTEAAFEEVVRLGTRAEKSGAKAASR